MLRNQVTVKFAKQPFRGNRGNSVSKHPAGFFIALSELKRTVIQRRTSHLLRFGASEANRVNSGNLLIILRPPRLRTE